MERLTKSAVEKRLKSGDPARYGDSEVPGLWLRVRGPGLGAWFFRYQAGGRRREMSLGRAAAVTLEDARNAARGYAGDVARGNDPLGKRDDVRREALARRLLCDVLDEWEVFRAKHASDIALNTREATARDVRTLKRHLGHKVLDSLSEADFTTMRDAMAESPASFTSALKRFRAFAKWCRRKKYLVSDPSEFSEGYISLPRERRATDLELRRIGKVLDDIEAGRYLVSRATGRRRVVPKEAAAIVRIALLSGLRIGEVLGLTRAQLDRDAGCIRLPFSKTSKGEDRRPLTRQTLAVVDHLPMKGPDALLFPKANGEPRSVPGMWDHWRKIRDAAGADDLRIHDLRRTFGSVAADLGTNDATIGAILGHKSASVTGRYTRPLPAISLDAANATADAIAAKLVGSKEERRAVA